MYLSALSSDSAIFGCSLTREREREREREIERDRERVAPKLQLGGQDIHFVADNTIKFLSGPITAPQTSKHHKKYLQEKLERLLERVEEVPVTSKQKLLLSIYTRLVFVHD